MHDVPAIHDQRVADHVGGVLRHQERHHARDFLDGAEAADRNVARARQSTFIPDARTTSPQARTSLATCSLNWARV